MADDTLSFKEMCARFDVTPRTLRYYEYIELLEPIREGRARLYTPREVARMTLILRAKRFGFSLEEIRQWLDLYNQDSNEVQLQAVIDLADRQLGVLDEQKAQLDASIAELQALRDLVAAELAKMSAPE